MTVLGVTASRSVFTAVDDDEQSEWSAASLSLTDNIATQIFGVADAVPGQTGDRCTTVDYTGPTGPGAALTPVTLYLANVVDTDGGTGSAGAELTLSDDVDLQVEVFTSADGTCSAGGTTVQPSTPADTFPGDFASGVALWTPDAGDESRDVRLTWTLGSDTASDAQGDSMTAEYVYEIRAGS